jgi:two-component system sensor histidine kinase UhpB
MTIQGDTHSGGVRPPRLDATLVTLVPALSARWRGVLAFLLVVVAVQAAYWGVVQPLLLSSPRTAEVDRIAFVRTQLAELAEPTPKAALTAAFTDAELPLTDCCDPSYLALRLTFDLLAVPPEGLGVVTYQQVDNLMVMVNGSIVLSQGRMAFGSQTFDGQRPHLIRLPSGLVRAGSNEIVFITVRQGFPYTDLVPPVLGPWEQVSPWAAQRMWQFTDRVLISGWTTFLLGLFAALLLWRAQDRRFAFWLMVLCWSWSGLAAYSLVLDPPFGGMGRMIAFFAVNSLVSAALLGFIDAWTGRPIRGLQAATAVAWLVFTGGVFLWLRTQPMPQAYDVPASVWTWFTLALGVAVVGRLVWHFVRHAESRRLEAALLSVCAVCAVLDAAGDGFGLNSGGYLKDAAPILLLALVAAFLQRNFTLFQSSVTLNAMLSERLTARETELEAAHARERERVRDQAHDEERRRIMRDMHDGLGSQLMGLLLSARRGKADPERMAEGLQAVIDEMRLMIDSMDSVGESLGSALTTFHERIRPRVEVAGFGLDWSSTVDQPLPDYPPRAVLQVFRILQEAVTNALKHSGGDRITINVDRSLDGAVRLTIADNGRGIQPGGTAGRGLANMRTRAAVIGAALSIDNDAPGGRIQLVLPASGDAP